MRALSVRWRLTAAFAAVMAVVLTATGLFVYQRQATNLDGAINRALRARGADVAALAQQSDTGLSDARPSGGRANRPELAQLIGGSGRVLDRTPGLPGRPLLTSAALTSARRGATVAPGGRRGMRKTRPSPRICVSAVRADRGALRRCRPGVAHVRKMTGRVSMSFVARLGRNRASPLISVFGKRLRSSSNATRTSSRARKEPMQ
jgi:hypothetical protein